MVLGALVVVVVGTLVVNYFKDRNGSTLPSISTVDEKQTQHVVVEGESLWSISEDYYGSGYNWVDLAKENELANYNIEVGQTIKLPDLPAKEPTAIAQADTQSETSVGISGDNYTVVKGDSLWDISVRAYGDGYRWLEVAKANKLDNPNTIHPGNILVLPR